MCIELVMPSNHLIFCHPLLLLPSISPSIRIFSNELALCIRWPKYWSFSFKISPSNEYSGLIAFRTLVWSPCCLRNSQESYPSPQFESIHFSGLSLLYGPAFTSVHDYWKSMGLCLSWWIPEVTTAPRESRKPSPGRSVLCVWCFTDFSRGHVSIDNVAFVQHRGPSSVSGKNLLFSKFNSF